MGYGVLMVWRDSEDGVKGVEEGLRGGMRIFGGECGVGKWRVVNGLVGVEKEMVRKDMCEKWGVGEERRRGGGVYELGEGGDVIDWGGVGELGVWEVEGEEMSEGSVELDEYLGVCKYGDWKEDRDGGWGMGEGVEEGKMGERGLEKYEGIVERMGEVKRGKKFCDRDE